MQGLRQRQDRLQQQGEGAASARVRGEAPVLQGSTGLSTNLRTSHAERLLQNRSESETPTHRPPPTPTASKT